MAIIRNKSEHFKRLGKKAAVAYKTVITRSKTIVEWQAIAGGAVRKSPLDTQTHMRYTEMARATQVSQVDFDLTQFLSGQVGYPAYLYRL